MFKYSGKKSINVGWVYKLKLKQNGETFNYKEKLVEKGFIQKPVIDFKEVYALVAIIETIILVTTIVAYRGWKMHQPDAKSAFHNGPL